MKLVVVTMILMAVAVVFVTNRWLSERFTETTRNRAELRLALYSGNIISELQRTSVVPLLLANDPVLVQSLQSGNFSAASQRLIKVQAEIGVASIMLLDKDARIVGATNRNLLGTNFRSQSFYVDALRAKDTVFTAGERETGGFDFTYSRSIILDGRPAGVIATISRRPWAGSASTVTSDCAPRERSSRPAYALSIASARHSVASCTEPSEFSRASMRHSATDRPCARA